MPNLPDLTAKLKIDLSALDTVGARAAAAGAGIKAGMGASSGDIDKVENSVSKLKNTLEPAGQAFVKFGDSGEVSSVRISSSSAKSQKDIDNLVARAKNFGSTLETEFAKGTRAVISLDEQGGAALRSVSQTTEQAGFSFSQFGQKISTAFSAVSEYAVPALVALAVAMSPVINLLAAFTVGLGAALTVGTLGAGAFTALAASAVLLADKTSQLNGPMEELEAHALGVADALGQKAAPAARNVLQFVDALLNPVGTLASHILDWVNSNDRLSTALSIAQDFANSFFDVLENKLGPSLGRFLDAWLDRGPQWEALWRNTLDFVAGAIDGLLQNLLRLSDWFEQNLPTIGPETQAVFDGLGTAIQAVGQAIALFLIPTLELLKGHEEIVKYLMIGLVAILGSVAVAFAALGLAVVAVGRAIEAVAGFVQTYIGPLAGFGQAHQTASGQVQQHTAAQNAFAQAANFASEALKGQKEALDTVLTGLEQELPAETQALAAEDQLQQLIKGGNATRLQERQALDSVVSAHEAVIEAQQQAAGQTIDSTTKAKDYAASLDYAAQKARAIGDSLDAAEFEAQADAIRQSAYSVSSAINSIPTSHTTYIYTRVVTQGDVAIGSPTGHASGGPVVPGRVYLVGEQGPELLAMGPGGSGYVYPNNSLETQGVLGTAAAGQDPRPTTMIQLLSDQNQLLRAWVQAMATQPQPVGRWPYAGRTT